MSHFEVFHADLVALGGGEAVESHWRRRRGAVWVGFIKIDDLGAINGEARAVGGLELEEHGRGRLLHVHIALRSTGSRVTWRRSKE